MTLTSRAASLAMEEEVIPMHREHISDTVTDSHPHPHHHHHHQDSIVGGVSDRWRFGASTFPKSELVYLSQVLLIYIVVCTCLFSLVTNKGDSNLWSALLSGMACCCCCCCSCSCYCVLLSTLFYLAHYVHHHRF